MTHGIYTAASGAVARQIQLDMVANNLANSQTTGFREMKAVFEEILTPATSDARHLVVMGPSRMSMAQGPMISTGDPMDLTIQGDGFFLTEEPDGTWSLLRTFHAHSNTEGYLVDGQGRFMLSRTGNPVMIDPDMPFQISDEGEVIQRDETVDRLSLVGVSKPSALDPLGHGVYRATLESGNLFAIPGEVISGAVEGSNVNPVASMVELIRVQRDFQSLVKAMQAYRDADDELIRTAGR